MKLNTGKKAFLIEFDNGDKDYIYFNPNDPDLASRLIMSKGKIEERMKELKVDEVNIPDGIDLSKLEKVEKIEDVPKEYIDVMSAQGEQIAKVVNSSKEIICEELDVAFGNNVSDVVFKHCSPFAVVEGKYFVLQFLEAIVPEIKKLQNTNERAIKHVGKYLKK